MKINWIVNPIHTYSTPGWKPDQDFLSGTEESIVEWSKELAKRGHDVNVYYNGPHMDYAGAKYRDYADYSPADVDINVKYRDFGARNPNTWYLTNETNADDLDLSPYRGVIFPSKWAKDNIPVNKRVEILPHGYDSSQIFLGKKIPKQVLYASSPDRGLDTLLRVWPEVARAHPDAQLIVTYATVLPKELPNVLFLGQVDTETMNELYRTSDIWCHPCNGGELYGMSGIKAQAAGCVPVYFPTMALAETVRHGVRSNPDDLTDDLIDILGNDSKKDAIRLQLGSTDLPTWESTTDRLLAILQA